MFRHEFQGGPCFEAFTVQGQDPLSKFKVCGPSNYVRKEFNKQLKSFVICLEGDAARTKVAFPKQKQSLHLLQSYLVVQLFVPVGHNFAIEVTIFDSSHQKRRFLFSTSNREVTITALHAKMPGSVIEQGVWLNLCLDLMSLVVDAFEGKQFLYIDSITISANCMLKRIFTLKEKPKNDSADNNNFSIPGHLLLGDINTKTQVIDMSSYVQANMNIRSGTGGKSRSLSHSQKISASQNTPSIELDSTHIAFGEKVAKPPMKRRNSNSKQVSSVAQESGTTTSRSSSRGKNRNTNELCITNSKPERQPSLELSSQKSSLQPHPPKCTAENVRKPRIKSADFSRQRKLYDETKFSKSANIQRDRTSHTNCEKLPSKIPVPNNAPLKTVLNSSHKLLSKSEIDIKSAEQLVALKQLSDSSQKSNSLSSLHCFDRIPSDSILTEKTMLASTNKINQCASDSENLDKNEKIKFKDSGVVLNFSDGGGLSGSYTDSVHNKPTNSCELLVADDDFEQEYLRKRTYSSSKCEDDLHSPSSSCTTSNNSDSLFLYSSRPKSVSERTNTVDRSKSRSPSRKKNAIDTSQPVSRTSSRKNSNCEAVKLTHETAITPEKVNDTTVLTEYYTVDSLEVPNLTESLEHSSSENEKSIKIEDSSNSNKTFLVDDDSPQQNDTDSTIVSSQLMDLTILNTKSTGRNNSSCKIKQAKMSAAPPRLAILKSSAIYNSCESDDMSWMNASIQTEKEETYHRPHPKQNLRQKLEETFGSVMEKSHAVDSDDGFSDGSDDTFVSPPVKIHNYRYQDEMNSLGATLDLAATIPMTPQVGDQIKSNDGNADINNNTSGPTQTLSLDDKIGEDKEKMLDLLYDPDLGCYYDPKSQKYYELN